MIKDKKVSKCLMTACTCTMFHFCNITIRMLILKKRERKLLLSSDISSQKECNICLK